MIPDGWRPVAPVSVVTPVDDVLVLAVGGLFVPSFVFPLVGVELAGGVEDVVAVVANAVDVVHSSGNED